VPTHRVEDHVLDRDDELFAHALAVNEFAQFAAAETKEGLTARRHDRP
jgi:hypothetical protein